MTKILLISSVIICLLLSGCSQLDKPQVPDVKNISSSGELTQQTENTLSKKEQKQASVQDKIEEIRKRLALKGLIIDGDGYYKEGQIALALVNYLEFYRKNPDDQLILEKLGNAYFSLHKYGSSMNYYRKITSPSTQIQDKIALSIIHQIDFSDITSIKAAQGELKDVLPEGELLVYYNTSLSCSLDFHQCKKDFGDYFWTEDSENTVGEIKEPFEKLMSIKAAIENYRNFQLDDVYLKDAFIVGAWYSNDAYSLSAHMGEKILGYKPGYKPILKIVAQSYFSLGEYEKARDALGKFQNIDDNDPGVNYMLGVIHTQLKDYVLANIYLNKALTLDSDQALEIQRQLIHNFYQLDNNENLLKEFVKLIESNLDYTQRDLGLGIYNHILSSDYDTALKWAKIGMEKFPDTAGDFYAYQAWILRDKGEFEIADSILITANTQFPDNPFILINLGYTALERNQKGAAISYFKSIILDYPGSEFAKNAQAQLDLLKK